MLIAGKKSYETVASTVLVYGGKFVLLYDNKFNHYVLPQGHKRKNETLKNAALREAKEETGYQELILQKKLGKYQYHFSKGTKTIYKSIHVYLIKILNNNRLSNTQNANEDFIPHLVTFKKGLKIARWDQDKKYIAIAKQSQK